MRTKSNKPTKRELLKMQKEAEEKLLAELKIEYNKSYDSILEELKTQKSGMDTAYRAIITKERYFATDASNLGVKFEADLTDESVESKVLNIYDKYDALIEQMYDEKISEGAELAEYQSHMNQFDRYKIPAKILKLANRCTDLLVEKLQDQCEEEIKKQIYFKAEKIMKAGRVEQYENAAKYYGGQKGSILKALNGTTSYNEALRNQYIIMKAREELPVSEPSKDEYDEHAILASISIYANNTQDLDSDLQGIVNKIYATYKIDQDKVKSFINLKCKQDAEALKNRSLMPAEEKGAFWRRRVAKIVNEDNKRALQSLSAEKQSLVEFKQTYHENALSKYLNLLGYMDASIEYILNTTDKQQKAVDRQKIETIFKNLVSKTTVKVENSEISQEVDDSVIEPSIQTSDVKISEDMALDTL